MAKNGSSVSERIFDLMKKRGLTQQEFGKKIAVSQPTLSRLKNGAGSWHIDQITTAAQVLGVDVLVLLGGEEPSKVSGRVCFELDPATMKLLLAECGEQMRTPENLASWVVASWLRAKHGR